MVRKMIFVFLVTSFSCHIQSNQIRLITTDHHSLIRVFVVFTVIINQSRLISIMSRIIVRDLSLFVIVGACFTSGCAYVIPSPFRVQSQDMMVFSSVVEYQSDGVSHHEHMVVGERHGKDPDGFSSFSYMNPPDVLDIGCGTGESTVLLARYMKDAIVLGVDLDESKIDMARERYCSCHSQSSDHVKNVYFDTLDARLLPFSPRSIPLIQLRHCLIEMSEETIRDILKECRRIVSRDGMIVIEDYMSDDTYIQEIINLPEPYRSRFFPSWRLFVEKNTIRRVIQRQFDPSFFSLRSMTHQNTLVDQHEKPIVNIRYVPTTHPAQHAHRFVLTISRKKQPMRHKVPI